MPRSARKRSASGIYHIMLRGINRQDIFHDEDDKQRFLGILKKVKETSLCEVYGYCLMGNHVHLLIREGKEALSQIMKRVGTAYAYWYNTKYERIGHLFQDRFKSENVDDDSYFLSVLRYIHQNPLKAKMVNTMSEYVWSSYESYIKKAGRNIGLTDTQYALGIFATEATEALQRYIEYMEQPQLKNHLEHTEKKKCTDEKVKYELTKLIKNQPLHLLSQIPKSERDKILRKLKEIEACSIRQIERITGIGRNIIAKA